MFIDLSFYIAYAICDCFFFIIFAKINREMITYKANFSLNSEVSQWIFTNIILVFITV